jgi:Beta-propeller repeat
MFNKLLVISFVFGFSFLACDVKVESEKFTCDPAGTECPDGMKCVSSGTELQTYCYDQSTSECGDGVIDRSTGEQCDGTDIPTDTASINLYCNGALINSCAPNCTAICEFCGNGVIDATGDEQCDGTNVGSASCESEGYYNTTGILECNPSTCKFDYGDCGGECGDGDIQNGSGEACDNNSLGVVNCEDLSSPFNYHSGVLTCATDCQYIEEDCEYCGDGIKNGTEECDETSTTICTDLGYFTGFACMDSCIINTNNCKNIIQWGTTAKDSGSVVATDSLNNIYVAGNTEGTMGATSFGQSDLFLTKFTSNGIRLWTRQLGTSYDDEMVTDITIDSSDNIYITGYSYGDLEGVKIGGRDVILIKFNSSGTKLWGKQWGTSSNDSGFGIAYDPSSSSIYITGYTRGNLYSTYQGGQDIFLAKYTTDGTHLWGRQYGGSELESGDDLAIGSSGNIYITGTTNSNLDGTCIGVTDLFLIKYTSDGTHIFTRQWGADYRESSYEIAIDSANNLYIIGHTERNFGEDLEMILSKYTSDGTWIWNKKWGGLNQDYYGRSIIIDSSDNIYTLRNVESFNISYLSLSNHLSNGDISWSKSWNSEDTDMDRGFYITMDSSDYIYITGETSGVLDGTNFGGYDVFLIRTDKNP